MINTSPEPFTNWAASITEDVAVIGGLWTALTPPVLLLVLLVLFVLLLIWLLPKVWRGIKKVFAFLGRLFSGGGGDDGPLEKAGESSTERRDGGPPPNPPSGTSSG